MAALAQEIQAAEKKYRPTASANTAREITTLEAMDGVEASRLASI
jgi:hypothetical protein